MALFIDIETIPGIEKPKPEDVKVPANYKNADTIQKYIEDNLDDIWKKQALDSMKGRIICIGLLLPDNTEKIIYGENEEDNITIFAKTVKDCNCNFVGHNLLAFDIPFLFHKLIKYKIAPPLQFRSKGMIEDTMKIFNPFQYNQYYKLSDISKFLNVPHDTSFDGSMVFNAFENGEHEKIKQHCLDDLRTTQEVYNRIQMYYLTDNLPNRADSKGY